jgi:hypothetical protein
MKRLMKFGDFFNEAVKINENNEEDEVTRIQDLFETDLLEQPFIKAIFGENPDYVLDQDTELTSTGLDNVCWIEIKNAPKEVLDKFTTKAYVEFAKPFEDWAKKHDLYDATISTPDVNDENSIIFTVNAGSADSEDTDEEE